MRAAMISMGSISSQWTLDAMKKYFDEVDAINLKDVDVQFKNKQLSVTYGENQLEKYDCLYVKGSHRFVNILTSLTTAFFDQCYMPIQASAFTIGHDKLLTQIMLVKAGISMPVTYLSPTIEQTKVVLGQVNYPIVMKFPSGTHGKGVMFADSYESASSMLDALEALKQPVLIQEYVETGGVDTRAIVVGKKVVAAMKRKAVQGEKRANIHAGGKGEACILDALATKIAVKAAQIVGADVCAVDILEGPKGPMVLEINLSPGLQGITEVTKIDVADHIAKYLYERTKERKEDNNVPTSDILSDLGISGSDTQEIISHLDFRGNRILLPEVVSKISGFNEKTETSIKVANGKVEIKKFSLND